jgi:hypothetical protein
VKPALFTAAAEADVEEAFHWYESQRQGLGARFRHAVDIAVAAVERNPEAYAIVLGWQLTRGLARRRKLGFGSEGMTLCGG